MMNKTENNNCINYESKNGFTLGQIASVITINSAKNLEVSYEGIDEEACPYANSCRIKDKKLYIYNEDDKEPYTGKDFVNKDMTAEISDLKLMIRNEDVSRIYDDFRTVTNVTIFKNKKTGKLTSIVLSNND